MSKKIITCITVLLFSGIMYAKGAFVEIGDPSFFPENSILVKLLADDAGNIFAGYVKDQKYSVAKFDGEKWSDVGNRYFTENIGGVPSTDDTYLYTSMTLDKDGVPYISYPSAKEYKLTVMRYDSGSNSWKTAGKAGFTDFMTTWTSVAINSEGIPYVVFGDCSSESCKEAVEVYPLNDIITPVSVMKYDGTDWVYVGDPFISGNELSYSQYNSIAFDSEDVPYVSFTDTSSESKLIKVKKYNGTDWQSVGADDLTGLSGDAGTLLVDSKNDLYVGNFSGVMRFEGEVWNVIVESELRSASFALDKGDSIYIAYTKFDNSVEKLSVKKFYNDSLTFLGDEEFFVEAYHPLVAVTYDSTVYTAFYSPDDSSLKFMKYDPEAGQTPDDSDDIDISDDDTVADENSTADEDKKDSNSSGCTLILM